MRRRLLLVALVNFIFVRADLEAQSQTVRFSRPDNRISEPAWVESLIDRKSVQLSLELLIKSLRDSSDQLKTVDYTIVHIVEWAAKSRKILKQRWFVHGDTSKFGGDWTEREINGARIFGSSNVGFVGIHRHAPDNLTYQIDITQKESAPVQSLRALAELAPSLVAAVNQPDSTSQFWMWTGGDIAVQHTPSDIEVRLKIPAKAAEPEGDDSEIAKQVFDNEGKYRWDFSVGLPVTSFHDLQYNAQDGTVRTEEIDKQSVLAFVNLHLMPVDTKQVRRKLMPSLLFGASINSRPLDRMVIALASGVTVAQIFVGASLDRVKHPETLKVGESATSAQLAQDSRARYDAKLIVGLNAPIRQVLDRVRPKK